jgi:hypothetical protein
MRRSCGVVALGLLWLVPASAAVVSRLSGQAYYDTVLDITWIADANLAATQSFGVSGLGNPEPGTMTWDKAQEWIAAMNGAGYLGVSDWRLTRVADTATAGCNLAFTGTDCGWNVDLATGEIAHLYHFSLGNIAGFDPGGVEQACYTAPQTCLANRGPFPDFQPDHYWTGTPLAGDASKAWEFNARIGLQSVELKTRSSYVWPVRDGDIALAADADGDGVPDVSDNCTLVANAGQCDSDGDGYGNRCDSDLNNNGFANAQDYILFRAQLGKSSAPPAYNPADINCNGYVNSQDYVLFRERIGLALGPSGLIPGPLPGTFLPYGSASPSVVFRHPLTSNPDGTGGLTATVYGAVGGPEHDAVKGMRGASAGSNTASGYRLTGFSASTLNALGTAGQVSFEVSTRYFSQASAYGGGSSGDSLVTQTTPIEFANAETPGNGQLHVLRRSAGAGGPARVTTEGLTNADGSQRSFLGWVSDNALGNAGNFTSYGKPANGFTRINVGWYQDGGLGNIVVLAVDGVVLQWAARDNTVNPFTHFTLGGAANWLNGGFVSSVEEMTDASHWIRNLQISTLAPTVPALATGPLKSIAIMSDSIIPATPWFNISWKDLNIDARITRAMEARGIRPATLYRMNAGGHTLIDGIGTPSFTSGDTSSQVVSSGGTSTDVRGLIKALNPTTIIINGGSNDVGYAGATATKFRAALRDHVEYFCGLDGTSHGGADYSASPPGVMPSYIFFTNIPDRGFNWDGAATATGTLNGTTTVGGVSVPGGFANGDPIGAYGGNGLYIPTGTTVVSGGGTATLVLSQAATGTGPVSLYRLARHADSPARQKAAAFRDEIAAMPAWFAATFPASTVKVRVIDTYTASGGDAVIPGKILADGVHPDYYGIYNGNEAIADALAGTL